MGEDQGRITIEQTHGDSPWVGNLPAFLQGMARGFDGRGERGRDARMIRAVASIYPALCRLDRESQDSKAEEDRRRLLLDGVPFGQAVNSDKAIERGLALFDQAWQSGAIALRASNGKLIPPNRGKVLVPACGYSVDHVRAYFLDRAVRIILRRAPKIYERMVDDLTDPSILPRLRRIGSLPTGTLNELMRGFENNAKRALFDAGDANLEAIARIHVPVLAALRKTLDARFPDFLELDAAHLEAVAETFTVPEQVQDLGQSLLLVQSPDAIRAIGAWDIRDITERVNEDRDKRGLPPVKTSVHATDIRVMRGLLGSEFDHLMEYPAALLNVFGQSVREVRELDIAPRQARVEQMTLFCQRYMSYLSDEAAIMALFLLSPEDVARVPANKRPSIPEVFFILEGLWGKRGYGRKFFETVLGTPDGAKSLRLMMYDLVGLKDRGSVKTPEDLVQIVSNSDLLDSHILKYMATK